jgi:uncharacterized membrane protein YdjX (TVP38/TMEM64 family)
MSMAEGQDTSLPRGQVDPPSGKKRPLEGLWTILRRLGPTSVLSAVALVSPIVSGSLILGTLRWVGPWLSAHGSRGMLVYVVAYWVLGGLALLPTYTHSPLGGWAFGFKPGLAAAMGSFAGAAIIAYWIARLAAGNRVTELIAEHPKWQAVYDALLRSGFWRSLFIVTLVRIPAAPFALTNVIMASARVPMGAFLIGTLLGLLPRTAYVVYFAADAGDLSFDEPYQIATYLVTAALAGVVVLIIAYIAKRTLDRVTSTG